MNAFIFSQSGYCHLVWMFHFRKLNSHIKFVLRIFESTFMQLLKGNGSVSIHQRNLQILATGISKTENGLNPVIMEEVFKFKNSTHNFRNAEN